MAPWDWVAQQAEKVGNVGSNIDIPKALGPIGRIPGDIGQKFGAIGSNVDIPSALGPIAQIPQNIGQAVGNVGSNIDIPAWLGQGGGGASAGGGGSSGGQSGGGAAGGAGGTGTGNITYQNLISPLAANMFYGQMIAPLMQQLGTQLQGQSKDWQNVMGQHLASMNMPPQFRAQFQKSMDQQGADQSNVLAAIQANAAAAPALDQLMNKLGAQQSLSERLYAEQMAARAAGTTTGAAQTLGLTPQEVQQIQGNQQKTQ